jgi:hypothetical protein
MSKAKTIKKLGIRGRKPNPRWGAVKAKQWQTMTDSEIAQALGFTQPNVHTMRKRLIAKAEQGLLGAGAAKHTVKTYTGPKFVRNRADKIASLKTAADKLG